MINFNHVKLRYIEPCNFLTKRTLVSQPSTLVVARDPIVSYYLNLSIYFPTIILVIMYYTPSMTVPHKSALFFYYRHQINLLSLVHLLLLINKFSFICEAQSCSIRIILIVAMCLPLPDRLSKLYIHRMNCIVNCAIFIMCLYIIGYITVYMFVYQMPCIIISHKRSIYYF